MTMKGHALLWHSSVPDYVGKSPSEADLSTWLAAHIEVTATHFAGTATDWDVVNEALEDHGGWGSLGLRESVFLTEPTPGWGRSET
jgi:GH35 family endo-1,4-beta-xylanase